MRCTGQIPVVTSREALSWALFHAAETDVSNEFWIETLSATAFENDVDSERESFCDWRRCERLFPPSSATAWFEALANDLEAETESVDCERNAETDAVDSESDAESLSETCNESRVDALFELLFHNASSSSLKFDTLNETDFEVEAESAKLDWIDADNEASVAEKLSNESWPYDSLACDML